MHTAQGSPPSALGPTSKQGSNAATAEHPTPGKTKPKPLRRLLSIGKMAPSKGGGPPASTPFLHLKFGAFTKPTPEFGHRYAFAHDVSQMASSGSYDLPDQLQTDIERDGITRYLVNTFKTSTPVVQDGSGSDQEWTEEEKKARLWRVLRERSGDEGSYLLMNANWHRSKGDGKLHLSLHVYSNDRHTATYHAYPDRTLSVAAPSKLATASSTAAKAYQTPAPLQPQANSYKPKPPREDEEPAVRRLDKVEGEPDSPSEVGFSSPVTSRRMSSPERMEDEDEAPFSQGAETYVEERRRPPPRPPVEESPQPQRRAPPPPTGLRRAPSLPRDAADDSDEYRSPPPVPVNPAVRDQAPPLRPARLPYSEESSSAARRSPSTYAGSYYAGSKDTPAPITREGWDEPPPPASSDEEDSRAEVIPPVRASPSRRRSSLVPPVNERDSDRASSTSDDWMRPPPFELAGDVQDGFEELFPDNHQTPRATPAARSKEAEAAGARYGRSARPRQSYEDRQGGTEERRRRPAHPEQEEPPSLSPPRDRRPHSPPSPDHDKPIGVRPRQTRSESFTDLNTAATMRHSRARNLDDESPPAARQSRSRSGSVTRRDSWSHQRHGRDESDDNQSPPPAGRRGASDRDRGAISSSAPQVHSTDVYVPDIEHSGRDGRSKIDYGRGGQSRKETAERPLSRGAGHVPAEEHQEGSAARRTTPSRRQAQLADDFSDADADEDSFLPAADRDGDSLRRRSSAPSTRARPLDIYPSDSDDEDELSSPALARERPRANPADAESAHSSRTSRPANDWRAEKTSEPERRARQLAELEDSPDELPHSPTAQPSRQSRPAGAPRAPPHERSARESSSDPEEEPPRRERHDRQSTRRDEEEVAASRRHNGGDVEAREHDEDMLRRGGRDRDQPPVSASGTETSKGHRRTLTSESGPKIVTSPLPPLAKPQPRRPSNYQSPVSDGEHSRPQTGTDDSPAWTAVRQSSYPRGSDDGDDVHQDSDAAPSVSSSSRNKRDRTTDKHKERRRKPRREERDEDDTEQERRKSSRRAQKPVFEDEGDETERAAPAPTDTATKAKELLSQAGGWFKSLTSSFQGAGEQEEKSADSGPDSEEEARAERRRRKEKAARREEKRKRREDRERRREAAAASERESRAGTDADETDDGETSAAPSVVQRSKADSGNAPTSGKAASHSGSARRGAHIDDDDSEPEAPVPARSSNSHASERSRHGGVSEYEDEDDGASVRPRRKDSSSKPTRESASSGATVDDTAASDFEGSDRQRPSRKTPRKDRGSLTDVEERSSNGRNRRLHSERPAEPQPAAASGASGRPAPTRSMSFATLDFKGLRDSVSSAVASGVQGLTKPREDPLASKKDAPAEPYAEIDGARRKSSRHGNRESSRQVLEKDEEVTTVEHRRSRRLVDELSSSGAPFMQPASSKKQPADRHEDSEEEDAPPRRSSKNSKETASEESSDLDKQAKSNTQANSTTVPLHELNKRVAPQRKGTLVGDEPVSVRKALKLKKAASLAERVSAIEAPSPAAHSFSSRPPPSDNSSVSDAPPWQRMPAPVPVAVGGGGRRRHRPGPTFAVEDSDEDARTRYPPTPHPDAQKKRGSAVPSRSIDSISTSDDDFSSWRPPSSHPAQPSMASYRSTGRSSRFSAAAPLPARSEASSTAESESLPDEPWPPRSEPKGRLGKSLLDIDEDEFDFGSHSRAGTVPAMPQNKGAVPLAGTSSDEDYLDLGSRSRRSVTSSAMPPKIKQESWLEDWGKAGLSGRKGVGANKPKLRVSDVDDQQPGFGRAGRGPALLDSDDSDDLLARRLAPPLSGRKAGGHKQRTKKPKVKENLALSDAEALGDESPDPPSDIDSDVSFEPRSELTGTAARMSSSMHGGSCGGRSNSALGGSRSTPLGGPTPYSRDRMSSSLMSPAGSAGAPSAYRRPSAPPSSSTFGAFDRHGGGGNARTNRSSKASDGWGSPPSSPPANTYRSYASASRRSASEYGNSRTLYSPDSFSPRGGATSTGLGGSFGSRY